MVMASDNEVMVLIYETVQKQMSQIKDTRVVVQSLANKVAEFEKSISDMNERTADMSARIEKMETLVNDMSGKMETALKTTEQSNTRLKDDVDAMRRTLDNVTNRSIAVVGKNNGEMKNAVRELTTVHAHVMDEFEQYELRLLKLEDSIDKMLTKQIIKEDSTNE